MQRQQRWMCALAGGLTALGMASLASAADLAVPGDFPTIQGAVLAAADGDVVIVAPGTYEEQVNTFGKAITIRSTDPGDASVVASTVLDGGGEGTTLRIIFGEGLDTVIDGLTITGGGGDLGGGMEISLSDPVIRRCVISGNGANSGGGAYLYVSSAWFDRCVFTDNAAGQGGAVYTYSTNGLRFDGCVFENNEAERGGAIRGFFSDVNVRNGVIRNNVATLRGGAYDGTDAQIKLDSTLVAGNAAPRGAVFYADDAGVRVRNSTIVDHAAGDANSGALVDGFSTQPIFYNSIVQDNAEPLTVSWITPYVRWSNFQGLPGGEGNIDADPLFVDAANGDYRLAGESPSAGAGFNGWVSSYNLRDLDGAARIQGEAVDQGAYETAGAFDPPGAAPGNLVAATTDTGALAYGVEQPLWLYDFDSETWSALVRDLPAYAITADAGRECFWLQAGDTGFFAKVPWATMEIEEIGRPKPAGDPTGSFPGFSGLAVKDGVIYGVSSPFGGNKVFTINPDNAEVTEIGAISAAFDIWDLAYDAANDQMLAVSSTGSLPSDQLGVVSVDLDTFEATNVLPWFNENPSTEAPALQGLAVGGGQTFLFRPLYNDLEIYEGASPLPVDALSVPGGTWVLGGLTWVDDLGGVGAVTGDVNGDCIVDAADIATILAAWGTDAADLDGDGTVNASDLAVVLSNFGSVCPN